jgi:hypothetical protein
VLTEETDIQRASIQELSKINIGLQDQVESLKKENRLLRHDQTERIIEGNNLRSVAYAATYAVECWDKGFGTPQAMPELKQALVNLEGG